MPRVSVALATFNGASHLAEQLTSILAQTRPVDEIVLSDDGSHDGTLTLVRTILAEATPSIVIAEDNPTRGVTGNFEHALRAVTGDIALLSDQDDVWLPDRVERTLIAFDKRPDIMVLHADAELVDVDAEPLGMTLLQALGVSAPWLQRQEAAGDPLQVFIRRNLATGATMAVRTKWAREAMPFPESWLHDEWLATLAAAEHALDLLRDPVIRYRQHDANAIGVTIPSWRRSWERMIEPRDGRLVALARRAAALAERADERELSRAALRLIHAKASFERKRSRYPRRRIARIVPVLRQTPNYPNLASQALLDVVRDLIQPAGTEP